MNTNTEASIDLQGGMGQLFVLINAANKAMRSGVLPELAKQQDETLGMS